MTTTGVITTRDITLIIPANDFAPAEGLSPEGIEVRDPEAYTILTETGQVLHGETLAAVTVAAGDYLFPNRTGEHLIEISAPDLTHGTPQPGCRQYAAQILLTEPAGDYEVPQGQPDEDELLAELAPHFNDIEGTVPNAFLITEMLQELSEDIIGQVITVTSADCHTNISGKLTDYHKEAEIIIDGCLTGKVALFFDGNITATYNLFDTFTTYTA